MIICNLLQQICQGDHKFYACKFNYRASPKYILFYKVINQVVVQLVGVVLYKIIICRSPVQFNLLHQNRRYGCSCGIFSWSFHWFWILNCEFDRERGKLFAHRNGQFQTYLHFKKSFLSFSLASVNRRERSPKVFISSISYALRRKGEVNPRLILTASHTPIITLAKDINIKH